MSNEEWKCGWLCEGTPPNAPVGWFAESPSDLIFECDATASELPERDGWSCTNGHVHLTYGSERGRIAEAVVADAERRGVADDDTYRAAVVEAAVTVAVRDARSRRAVEVDDINDRAIERTR